MAYRDVPVATVKCPGCSADVPGDAELCPACGNPVDIGRFAELELKVRPDLKKARTFLGVLTGLSAVGLAMAATTQSRSAIIAAAFSLVFFGACFLVAFRRPLGASMAAMALFLFNEAVVVAHGHFGRLFEGLILKIVFLTLLGAGIRAGYRVRDLRGQWRQRDLVIGVLVLAGSVVGGLVLGLLGSARGGGLR